MHLVFVQLDISSHMQYFTLAFHPIAFRPYIYTELYICQSSGKFQGAQEMDFYEKYLEAILSGIWTSQSAEYYIPRKSFKGEVHFQECVSGHREVPYTA